MPDQETQTKQLSPEGQEGAPPQAPAGDMVPKADLLRVQGEKGSLQAQINKLQSEIASYKDREDFSKTRKAGVTDEEREQFENEWVQLKARQRELEGRAAEIEKRDREVLVSQLITKYPLIKAEDLSAMKDQPAAELRAFAAEKYAERLEEKGKQAAETQTAPPAKTASSAARLDSGNAGSASAQPGQLTPQEKIQIGMQKYVERTAAAREGLYSPNRR